jgi:Mrp family chromosome partitioning ATPase
VEHIEKALAKARQMRAGRGDFSTIRGIPPSSEGVKPDYTHTPDVVNDSRMTAAQRLIADSIEHDASDVYRLLRTQVLQRLNQRGFSSLAVTGADYGVGTTTTAANLAISIALDVNQTVLLVDLNLRSPEIYKKFALTPSAGIEDYLAGQCELKDCLVNPGMARLVVLPARSPKVDSAEIISSPRMTALARELRARYADRKIIYDMPPLLTSGETLGFLNNADAVLFVARSGRTTKAELDRAANLLANFQVIGTLLNAH